MIARGAYKTDEKIKFDVAIGRALRKARKEKNITQLQLAKTIGIDEKQVSRYEYGDSGLSCHRFKVICDALKISSGELINNI